MWWSIAALPNALRCSTSSWIESAIVASEGARGGAVWDRQRAPRVRSKFVPRSRCALNFDTHRNMICLIHSKSKRRCFDCANEARARAHATARICLNVDDVDVAISIDHDHERGLYMSDLWRLTAERSETPRARATGLGRTAGAAHGEANFENGTSRRSSSSSSGPAPDPPTPATQLRPRPQTLVQLPLRPPKQRPRSSTHTPLCLSYCHCLQRSFGSHSHRYCACSRLINIRN